MSTGTYREGVIIPSNKEDEKTDYKGRMQVFKTSGGGR
jgi:hypothetical protein